MKLILIFLLLPVFCKAQTVKFAVGTLPSLVMQETMTKRLSVRDSVKGEVCYQINDTLFVKDSLATIKVLMNSMSQAFEQFKKINQEKDAAENILDYMKTNGQISDKKKFDEAVKKYLKIRDNL
jgi:hypothetical protein